LQDLNKYFPDNCFKCNNNSFEIHPKEVMVLKTKIHDFPHIKCRECGTNWLVSDLLEKTEKALISLKEQPKEALFQDFWELIEN
jgi:uncharacterized Zn finger protein